MRHGRPFLVKDHHHDGAYQLGDILLMAAITKTLSTSGAHNLPDPHTLPLSEPLLFQILRAQSLHPSKKLDFFKWCYLTHNIKHFARTYSHILRTTSCSGFLHDVPQLLHSMKEDGVVVDSRPSKPCSTRLSGPVSSITLLKFWILWKMLVIFQNPSDMCVTA
ncbi:hypothetical protein ACFXTH_000976 [Malus domestica]